MNYDFNKPLVNLEMQPVKDADGKDLTIGKVLANSLVSQGKGNALRFWDWAKAMYNAKHVDLSRSDIKELKDFVESSDTLTVMSKAQMIEVLDEYKD